VLAEAREAGCAIVASDVGGISEALDHGEAGILLPAGQPRMLANTLAFLLSNGRELSKWQSRATKNLSWLVARRAALEMLDVYKELIPVAANQGASFEGTQLKIEGPDQPPRASTPDVSRLGAGGGNLVSENNRNELGTIV
jgi:hypothetical protein